MTRSRGFTLVCVATFVVVLIVFALSPGANRADAQAQGTPSPGGASTEAATVAGTPAACTDFLQAAIAATDKGCANTGRNQVCYGNISLKAEAQPGVSDFSFDQPGQTVPIASIRKLELSSLDSQSQTWGVALMRLQANLPDTAPGQNVTILLFGNVSIEDSSVNGAILDATIASDVTPRQAPITGAYAAKLTANTAVKVTGKLADGSWLRVMVASSGHPVWVPAKNVTLSLGGDPASLEVVDAKAPAYGAYQAFYLRTGTGQAGCSDAPRDGIMIQSPKGAARVNLAINGAQVSLGSTVVVRNLTGDSGELLAFSTLEGSATIQATGKTQTLAAGNQLEVPLDSKGTVSGPPGKPHPYTPGDVEGVPVSVLPVKIAVKIPLACKSGFIQSMTFSMPALPPGVPVPPGFSSSGGYTAPCYCANGSRSVSLQYATELVCN